MVKSTITLLSLVFIASSTSASTYDPADLQQAYTYLNQLRERAGMTPFSQNRELATAASNHANYLTDNSMTGHYENEGDPGFTGIEPKDRTASAGYLSLLVAENVSSNEMTSVDSIDGLMSAIYHRLGFLDFVKDEVGIGIAQIQKPNFRSSYVYNMGNSGYNALCQGPAFTGIGTYYTEVCHPELKLAGTEYDKVTTTAQGNNPKIILWPVEGDREIPPAFFEESPDPLPDYSVSGYPISIQFNPLSFTQVNLSQFKLYRESDHSEIQSTRLLTKKTDPNKKLTDLEFVLFPLERLEWNTQYRAEVKYDDQTLSWRFQTKSPGAPLFTIEGNSEVLKVPPNADFAVYLPPTQRYPDLGQLNYKFNQGVEVKASFKDNNTLLLNLSGKTGQKATFTLSGKRDFSVELDTNATLPIDSRPEETLPSLGNAQKVGSLNVSTTFTGGISVNGGSYQRQVVQSLADTVVVKGEIMVDPRHVDEVADLFVYAETTLPPLPETFYFMLDEQLNIFPWDRDQANLVPFKKGVRLGEIEPITIYQGQFYYPGTLKTYFGYRLEDGATITNSDSINITINP